jgi:alkylhydroperoxidase/carboxymuconolactone decarboxylase family protein YurZ
MRKRIFKRLGKKVITLDQNTTQQLRELDSELNKIGVNLNQISKLMNSFSGYNIDDKDRQLLRCAFKITTQCLAFLQKHLK